MVRLVFRPYTRVKQVICTSTLVNSSTYVSKGFESLRNSSPSLGSLWHDSQTTNCIHTFHHAIKLLGPCYKTGLTIIFCELLSVKFHISRHLVTVRSFLRSTMRYRSLMVFSLRWSLPPAFTLHYQTKLLPNLLEIEIQDSHLPWWYFAVFLLLLFMHLQLH